jgi:hypothetical protein
MEICNATAMDSIKLLDSFKAWIMSADLLIAHLWEVYYAGLQPYLLIDDNCISLPLYGVVWIQCSDRERQPLPHERNGGSCGSMPFYQIWYRYAPRSKQRSSIALLLDLKSIYPIFEAKILPCYHFLCHRERSKYLWKMTQSSSSLPSNESVVVGLTVGSIMYRVSGLWLSHTMLILEYTWSERIKASSWRCPYYGLCLLLGMCPRLLN